MTQQHPKRVVIVGGVAAGMSTATRLRRRDEHCSITVLERGPYVSFANCGLPYHVSGVIADRASLLLQTPESLRTRFNLDVRVGHEVVAIDRDARSVAIRDVATGQTATLEYDDLVLATGASAITPTLPGADRAVTMRDVPDLDRVTAALATGNVRTACVIGGGFIGLEVAENLHAAGVQVAIVELADQLLPPFDPEMAVVIADAAVAHGVNVQTSRGATQITDDAVLVDDGTSIPADLVIMSIGVRPESALAKAAGLTIGAGGGVVVDAAQRTCDPHIYAAGDVAEKVDAVTGDGTLIPLAQTANRHGRLIADAICGRDVSAQPVLGTAIVGAFGVTAAATGWSEKRLAKAGWQFRVIHTHPQNHAGYYPGAQPMSLKLLVDTETDAILGAQAVGGDGVDKRIDVIATAMRAGLTASDLADLELAYAPQYGSAKDPVNMLGMVADNLAHGLTRTIQWHEVDAAVRGGAALIDVRSAGEFTRGTLPGARNISVDDLRARHNEIGGADVVVFCQVGQRGHVATSLLGQLGYTVRNLDGGYATWSAGSRARAQAAR